MSVKRPKLEEWDLPSDADMLRWVEAAKANLHHCYREWIVSVPTSEVEGCSLYTVVARGSTPHEALERAMKERS